MVPASLAGGASSDTTQIHLSVHRMTLRLVEQIRQAGYGATVAAPGGSSAKVRILYGGNVAIMLLPGSRLCRRMSRCRVSALIAGTSTADSPC
jgi:hypothetical protein